MLPIVEKTLTEFYSRPGKRIGLDRFAIWDRVMKMGRDILGVELFPHALRATYGSLLANNPKMTASSLKKLMGWANLVTADSYIESDTEVAMRTANEISEEVFNKKE